MCIYTHKRGESGIGALIIFIAAVFIAAVAAAVLMQTANNLQQKTLSVGQQAKQEISTHLQIIEVRGTGQVAALNNISVVARLAPGSDPVQFENSILIFSSVNNTTQLQYDPATTYGNTTAYGVTYLQEGSNYIAGIVARGDIAVIHFSVSSPLVKAGTYKLLFIPKSGTPTTVLLQVPEALYTEQVYLYP
jgi:archaeal flagellin FlaB